MGSFAGHALPGFFMILYGLRLAYCVLVRYFETLDQKQEPKSKSHRRRIPSLSPSFYSHPFYNYSSFLPFTCADAYLCLIFSVLGFVAELGTAFEGDHFVIHNLQHMLMYTGFGTAGLLAIHSWNGKETLPEGADYASLIVAIFIEGLLFVFHLHERSMIDVHVHQLLVITIVLSLVATVIEWRQRDNPLAALFRAACFLVQGTWFWQIGFILYNPMPGSSAWPDHDHEQMMIVTSLFAIHVFAVIFFVYAMAGFLHTASCCRPGAEFSDVAYECIVVEDDSDTHVQPK